MYRNTFARAWIFTLFGCLRLLNNKYTVFYMEYFWFVVLLAIVASTVPRMHIFASLTGIENKFVIDSEDRARIASIIGL